MNFMNIPGGPDKPGLPSLPGNPLEPGRPGKPFGPRSPGKPLPPLDPRPENKHYFINKRLIKMKKITYHHDPVDQVYQRHQVALYNKKNKVSYTT
jgi:hypothetical protein